jgi:two-component system response regulator HydG
MPDTLLIVDDNESNLQSMALALGRPPCVVLTAGSGGAALKTLREQEVDVIVTDLKMPEVGGMEVLEAAKSLPLSPEVIIVTAYGTIESAVEAMRQGAFDYITKPVNIKELRIIIEKAVAHHNIKKENIYLHTQLERRYGFEGIIGETKEMQDLFEKARLIAKTKTNVLILGESGTGKEILARAIHLNSPRAKKTFIPLHCAALPETLLESELFGYEKGAFTGAAAHKAGRFELADEGTIFLDEIADIPLSMQVKLLRVLETKEFVPVGGTRASSVDVRIIAATNKNLEEEVAEGRFREDLYYRLKVVSLELPPLRNRKADIPALVKYFLGEFSQEYSRTLPTVTKRAMARLLAYHWPGNVRQLRNCIENIMVFLTSDTIDIDDLPDFLQNIDTQSVSVPLALGKTLDAVEKEYVQQTLLSVDGNRTHAAEILGISRRTLLRKLKELGINGG